MVRTTRSLLAATVFWAASASASASEAPLVLGEVAAPPPSSGIDRATLVSAAERELADVDTSRLPRKRHVLVSLAITNAAPSPYACTVNALFRDAKTGTLVAIVEGRARAEGAVNGELRNRVVRAAIHSALMQLRAALSTK